MRVKPDVTKDCDVLVVGGGLAGCLTAITAKNGGAGKVILVDKGKVSRSGQSTFAAGIWALRLPEEDLNVWVEETITLGDYLNDQAWVKLLWDRVYEVAVSVDKWCAESNKQAFEKDETGKYLRRKSRGHIKTANAVINSIAMMEGLRHKARRRGVELVERVMVTDLIRSGDAVVGAVGINYRSGQTYLFRSKTMVLAAAGAGFKGDFIGHRNLTGDLQAAALRRGVVLRNMENISYNTGAKDYDIHGLNLYVSVGGKWLNARGEEFMWDYDPILGNRANQPTKCIALAREIHEGRGPIMFDMSAASQEERALCRKILPESFKTWDRAGIDPFEQRVEWITSVYGTIINGGGIHIDTECATNLAGLYAAGDITCIPPHGGYSFGGVNIAFTAVSGVVAGENCLKGLSTARQVDWSDSALVDGVQATLAETLRPLYCQGNYSPDEAVYALQEAFIPYPTSVIKSRARLEGALDKIGEIKMKLNGVKAQGLHDLVKANEAKNLAILAEVMLRASLLRKESRGFHFREDYPLMDNKNWLKWLMVQEQNGQIKFWTQDIPTPFVRPALEYQRHRSLRQRVEPASAVMEEG